MDQICISCLAQNRNLSYIDSTYWYIFQIIKKPEIIICDKMQICWECKAHLRRFNLFIKRIQSNLLLQWCSDIKKFKCQSSLSIVKLTGCTSQNVNSNNDTIIKTEYVPNFHDYGNIDMVQNDQFSENLWPTVKNEDLGEVKIENEGIDYNLPHDGYAVMEENYEKIPEAKESMVAAENHVLDDYSGMWITEMVSEEQLRDWRNADENVDKYRQSHWKCTTCLVAFNYEDQLQKHNTKYHCERLGPHTCDVCQARFPLEHLMKEHREQHLTLYKCLNCQFSCRGFGNLKKHLIDAHVEASFRCDQCDAVFKTVTRMRYHKEKHIGKHKCRQCNKAFNLRSNMYNHMVRKHGNLPREQCRICKKMYKNKYALKTHLKVHAEVKETYYCIPCNVHFKTALIYKQHIANSKKHLKPEDLKYKCEECDRRFVSEKQKQAHFDTIHLKKGQFPCDKCSKSYGSRSSLKYHTALKHNEGFVRPPRDKICDICGKGFPSKTILTSHIRTHTGERPYKCELCTSTFAHSGALYTHRKLVHLKMKRKESGMKTRSKKECV